MYAAYFALTEPPFSISPDPRYLYTSARHQEAMAHLMYGVRDGGGFVQLTGEVGTGKTTLCRWLLDQVPDDLDVALILNPQFSENELLASICDELRIRYPANSTTKKLLDLLNKRLLSSYAKGRRTVLIIDEAQMLSKVLLEQVRLLTNLETAKQKLLQIILIGQPELNTTLDRDDLKQLSQRVTARYHLRPLSAIETKEYVGYRLAIAGGRPDLFTQPAMRLIHRYSQGVPRLINVICDRALLGAYSEGRNKVNTDTVRKAAAEVLGFGAHLKQHTGWYALAASMLLAAGMLLWYQLERNPVEAGKTTETNAPAASAAANTLYTDNVKSEKPMDTAVTEKATEELPPIAETADTNLTADQVTQPDSADEQIGLLDVVQQASTDEASALTALLHYWGVQLTNPALADCEQAAKVGFRCLRSRGTWNNLRNLNRAVVLTLRGPQRNHYVLLTALEPKDQATLLVAEKIHQFNISVLDHYWFGEYLLLWRPPPSISHPIARHSRGADVLWLRQALSRVDNQGPAFDVANPEFDQQLYDRIIGFQRRHALDADGIVGVETLIKLNSYLRNKDTPFLLPPTS